VTPRRNPTRQLLPCSGWHMIQSQILDLNELLLLVISIGIPRALVGAWLARRVQI
jgi:hypothetical protein